MQVMIGGIKPVKITVLMMITNDASVGEDGDDNYEKEDGKVLSRHLGSLHSHLRRERPSKMNASHNSA